MSAIAYEVRVCEDCGLRYPLVDDHPFGIICPHCGGETRVALRQSITMEPPAGATAPGLPTLEALLDNIRSAWNVGSMFRTADGLGIAGLHLCGITATPENDAVGKTALGAERSVRWSYHKSALDAARMLKAQGKKLWALEQDARARSILESAAGSLEDPTVLIVGNEVTGVDPGVLDLCDQILCIPMAGTKRSLNVAVAFGLAAHTLQIMQRARR